MGDVPAVADTALPTLVLEGAPAESAPGSLAQAASEALAEHRPGLLKALLDPETIRALAEHVSERTDAKGPKEVEYVAKLTAEFTKKSATGEWRLLKTKDGELLADVIDRKSKFAKKLRLEERQVATTSAAPKQAVGDAVGHAVTHALLRQLAQKMEVIDRKLDDVLSNQKFEWWEDIHSAVWSLELAQERGARGPDDPQVAVALHSLRKGGGVGRRHVARTVARLHELRHMSAFKRAGRLRGPQTEIDELLAELEADLGHMLLAAEVLSKWLVRSGLGGRALDEYARLDEVLVSLGERLVDIHRLGSYSPEKDTFWDRTLSGFKNRSRHDRLILEIPIDVEEVRLLASGLEE